MKDFPFQLRREFPEFEALRLFEAGLPIYFVRLALEVLEPLVLSSFQWYVLRAIDLGVTTPQSIARLLGVEARDLVGPSASLLKLGLIHQGLPLARNERPLSLTTKGQQVLLENSAPPVPKRKMAHIHFNALTWIPIPLEEHSSTLEQINKEGIFILPAKEARRPTLGDFTEEEVAQTLTGISAFQGNKLLGLLELRKVEAQYIAPVTVVLLQHHEMGEQRLAVYRNGVLQQPESVALQRLYETRKLKLPADAASLKERGLDIPLTLPLPVAQATRDLVQNAYDVQEIELQLSEQETRHTMTQSAQEQQELQERIRDLKEELRLKRLDHEALNQQLRQNHVEFLRTEQHRPLLEQALREAEKEIVLISPWMNRRACNDYLCRLIGQAITRGVHIRIGYGMGQERDATEADRNRHNVLQVREAINRFIPSAQAHLLEMKATSGTHQKILICDRKFAITGSFNWLSYKGDRDEGYRNETGTLFRASNQVNELAIIALQAFTS